MKLLEYYVRIIIIFEILDVFSKMIYKEDIIDRVVYFLTLLMTIPVLIYLILV